MKFKISGKRGRIEGDNVVALLDERRWYKEKLGKNSNEG